MDEFVPEISPSFAIPPLNEPHQESSMFRNENQFTDSVPGANQDTGDILNAPIKQLNLDGERSREDVRSRVYTP